MKRREFIKLVGVAAASSPLAARGQPAEPIRRIAVLMDAPLNDRSRPRLAAFVQGLLDLGWNDGRNVRIDIRWGANNSESAAS